MSHKWWNVFLDTEIFKGPHFSTLKILNSQSHCKPTETFQCTHFSSCHPFNMKRGFIKREALSLLRTNLVRRILTNTNKIFNKDSVTEAILWRLFIKSITTKTLHNKTKKVKEILPFVTTYNTAISNLKKVLMKNWHTIQQQPRLTHIF